MAKNKEIQNLDSIISYNHFSDTHVDQLAKLSDLEEKGLPLFVAKSISKIEDIIDNAIEEKKQLVIFAGDMFKDAFSEPRLKMEIQHELIRIFSKLQGTGIQLVLDNGNHDNSVNIKVVNNKKRRAKKHLLCIYDIIKYDFVHVSDPEYQTVKFLTLNLNNGKKVLISLVPYFDKGAKTKSELFKELLEKREELKDSVDGSFLVIHADIVGALMNDKNKFSISETKVLDENPNIYKRAELDALGYDVVCAGHYHLFQEICKNGYFCGSHMILSFGEEGEDKGYIAGELNTENKELTVEHKIIPDILWKSIAIDCLDVEPKDINSKIISEIDKVDEQENLKGAVVWMRLGNISNEQIEYIDEKYIKEYLNSKKVLVTKDFEYKYVGKGSGFLNNNVTKAEEDGFTKSISLNEVDILNEFLTNNNILDESQRDIYKSTLQDLIGKLSK